jgi:hypothetical protein
LKASSGTVSARTEHELGGNQFIKVCAGHAEQQRECWPFRVAGSVLPSGGQRLPNQHCGWSSGHQDGL